jgi:hypothetical protein
MEKKLKRQSLEVPEPAKPQPGAPSGAFLSDPAEQNELADLKRRVQELEDVSQIRKRQYADLKTTIVHLLKAIKKVESTYGVKVMARGEFYEIEFE